MYSKLLLFTLSILLSTLLGFSQTTTNTIVFSDDFTTGFNSAIWGYYTTGGGTQSIVTESGSQRLLLQNNTAGIDKVTIAYKDINFVPLRGSIITISGDAKAENVTEPINSYNGLKFQLAILKSDNTTAYPEIGLSRPTLGWIRKGITVYIPMNATTGRLNLGLAESTGKVWFDNIQIKVKRSVLDYPAGRTGTPPQYNPFFRGVMMSNAFDNTAISNITTLKNWKANTVRWQLGIFRDNLSLTDADYDALLAAELVKLDGAIPYFKQACIRLILDLHTLSQGCLTTAAGQQKIENVWKQLATKYKNEPTIWAYDLANEPVEDGTWKEDVLLWEDMIEKVAKSIRVMGDNKLILIESLWGLPDKFTSLKPLDFTIPNIIYSPHFYEPLNFTAQGVAALGFGSTVLSYPGIINGVMWDKNQLINALQPVKAFQDKYKVPILVGEFSAIRWAPNNSAFNYLKDAIEIFESYQWHWVYHAFREYEGWSVELTTDRNNLNPSPTQTDREALLRSYFNNNTCVIIPVELKEISAKATDKTNLLTWQTASERNSAWFDIQRSADGIFWENIDKIKALGNSSSLQNYTWEDKHPLSISLYRLHQIDQDGQNTYSKIVSVERNSPQKTIKIYPNPTTNGKLFIHTEGVIEGELLDIFGRSIKVFTTKTLDFEQLNHGVYFIKINANNSVETFKIIYN